MSAASFRVNGSSSSCGTTWFTTNGRSVSSSTRVICARISSADPNAEAELVIDVTVELRGKRRMFRQSYVGALYTGRNVPEPGADMRHTVGADDQSLTARDAADVQLDENQPVYFEASGLHKL